MRDTSKPNSSAINRPKEALLLADPARIDIEGWLRPLPGDDPAQMVDLSAVAGSFGADIERLPFSVRVLLENAARNHLAGRTPIEDVAALVGWSANVGHMLSLFVPRVILPDSSGVPALMDLAALRDVVVKRGGDAKIAEPLIPVDLIVDHSLQVDVAGTREAFATNITREIARNDERYRFLKWADDAFLNVTIHPPGSGIIHQINLEKLAQVVRAETENGRRRHYPDFVIGGDSHTPMVGGLGVLGWGVGGIDAETAMLGSPYFFPVPDVVVVHLTGALKPGITATDLVLSITEFLRGLGVVGKIVEFGGPPVRTLRVPERATLANMAPEYGATCGFFPVDDQTIAYLAATRTDTDLPRRVKTYARANALWRDADEAPPPDCSDVHEFDLGRVEPSVAGPRRPQDRLRLSLVGKDFRARLTRNLEGGGFRTDPLPEPVRAPNGMADGAIAIAALTSCTNTSNPRVMIAAGLLARKARARGLFPPAYVKRSLAPGSRVVTAYLDAAGLSEELDALGFHLIGYGCTTCGGKSGPLDSELAETIDTQDLVAAAVLSGNRNFEGRIHRQVRANYIMSPPLVVAFALAGRIDIDLIAEPLGEDAEGRPVYLADLWPDEAEIDALEGLAYDPEAFAATYTRRHSGHDHWAKVVTRASALYPWDPASTYLLRPPFFDLEGASLPDTLTGIRLLGLFGDALTTDHISPGGEIPLESPAGQYLLDKGVAQKDFNTYVGRRGNDQVMTRATFANIRLKNQMVPGVEGWRTLDPVTGDETDMFDAAMSAKAAGIPLVVMGGASYGTGSSRDWAAKGSLLLGLRVVIAESYERIHRSNLIGVGILPLLFPQGAGWKELGVTGSETLTIGGIENALDTGAPTRVRVEAQNGNRAEFLAPLATVNAAERQMIRRGGIFGAILDDLQPGPELTGTEHA